MAKQTYSIIEGFLFTDEKSAARARKEAESVRFLKGKIDKGNPAQVLELYQKMIKQKMFETPVGYAFLVELQDYLKTKPTIRLDEIPAIPVAAGLDTSALMKDAFENRARSVEEAAKEELKRRDAEKNIFEGEVVSESDKTTEKEKSSKKTKQAGKGTLGLSVFLNIILAVIVVGMFAISYTRGSTTILNYEEEIINKYSNWESELNDREAAIREKESELGIDN
ncbi:MAG: hypothetical protein K6E13_07960 [Lachnospiraceae bacterium]|nr:hypothetical protein [Lachnospiraceae bacterium]